MFASEIETVKRLGVRHILLQSLNFATVICTAFMLWKSFSLIFSTESPIVVVLSGSMEPAFYRGDLLWLSLQPSHTLAIGDITVYNAPGNVIPIVHRVTETHVDRKGEQWLLTKGDNNPDNDVVLYNGLKFLKRDNIVGKVDAYVPYVGYVTIMMNDFPKIKYALLGALGFGILLHRE